MKTLHKYDMHKPCGADPQGSGLWPPWGGEAWDMETSPNHNHYHILLNNQVQGSYIWKMNAFWWLADVIQTFH